MPKTEDTRAEDTAADRSENSGNTTNRSKRKTRGSEEQAPVAPPAPGLQGFSVTASPKQAGAASRAAAARDGRRRVRRLPGAPFRCLPGRKPGPPRRTPVLADRVYRLGRAGGCAYGPRRRVHRRTLQAAGPVTGGRVDLRPAGLARGAAGRLSRPAPVRGRRGRLRPMAAHGRRHFPPAGRAGAEGHPAG